MKFNRNWADLLPIGYLCDQIITFHASDCDFQYYEL